MGPGLAAVDNDLFQSTVEPGQGIRDVVGLTRVAAPVVAPAQIGLRDTLDLPRQPIETVVDGGEVLADLVVKIVIIAADGSTFVAHAFDR